MTRLAPATSARRLCTDYFTPRPPSEPDWEREQPGRKFASTLLLRCGVNALQWDGAGPTVILMHGWNGRPTQFVELAPRLCAAGFRVLALNGPGHGSPSREPGVLGFTRLLLDAADELGPVEAVLGHSMGGAAAAMALARGMDARRLVTISAPASLGDALVRHVEQLNLPHRLRRLFLLEADRHLGQPANRIDTALLADGLPIEALVVHDRDDPIVPFGDAMRIADALPCSTLLACTGLRHTQALRHPETLTQIVDFLAAPHTIFLDTEYSQ